MKTNTKHTSGPWTLGKHNLIRANGRKVAYVPEDETEERAFGHIVEVHSKEANANARLIAAAPELLAALQRIDERTRAETTWRSAILAVREIARAAIAKAAETP